MARYDIYNHYDSGITKISELVSSKDSRIQGVSIGELVGFESDGVTNLERIYSRYHYTDFKTSKKDFDLKLSNDINKLLSYNQSTIKGFIPAFDLLKVATEIRIPRSMYNYRHKLSRVGAKSRHGTTYREFFRDALKLRLPHENDINALNIQSTSATVLILCRALSIEYNDGVLIDISSILKSVNISKNADSGSFTLGVVRHHSMDLSPISMNVSGVEPLSDVSISDIVSPQDLVFISFSDSKVSGSGSSIVVDNSVLDNINFDMIGVISSSPKSTGKSTSSVNISGEDLSLILKKDNSAIQSQRYISNGKLNDISSFSGGIQRFQGKFLSTLQFKDIPIEDQIRFILDYQGSMSLFEGITSNIGRTKVQIPEYNLIIKKVSGIMKLIDVFVDADTTRLRPFNSDIGNSSDSLMLQIKRFADNDFVELNTGTYLNKFFVIARKPPFDRESVLGFVRDPDTVALGYDDIRSISISREKNAFSWYKVDYKILTQLFKKDLDWLFPAIHFPEYASVWGDQPKVAVNPYMEINTIGLSGQTTSLNKLASRMIDDLRFIIECNAYIPFTYKGSVNINTIRSIRAGTWIIVSDWIFYVDSVSKSVLTNQQSTSVQVSRGMKLENIEDYFNVISLNDKVVQKGNLVNYVDSTLSSWRVDKNIFNKLLNHSDES